MVNERKWTPIPSTEEEMKQFWEWAGKTYSPDEVEILRGYSDIMSSPYFSHFLEYAYTPPEGLGMSARMQDRLNYLARANPSMIQRQIDEWYTSGLISPAQHYSISREGADLQRKQFQLGVGRAITPAPEELAPEGIPDISRFDSFWGWAETKYTPEEIEKLRAMPDIHKTEYWAFWEGETAPSRPTYRPSPRYEPALEELRTGFFDAVPQTEQAMGWFRSKYPRLIEQFEAKMPEFGEVSFARGQELEAEREVSWAEFAKKKELELKEEWYRKTPYQRGERPSAFRPRIQTVGFR